MTETTAIQTDVVANFDNTVDSRDVKFHFKKDNLGNKRETVELKLGMPSVEGLVKILETGGKGLDLLLAAAADIVISQARSILNENDTMTDKEFPYAQCAWDFIANMPEAEKRGRGIPKEVWEAFAADYVSIMPSVTGKTAEQVGNAVKIFLNKFQAVKSNKPVLSKLKEQLAIYISNSPNAEEYTDAVKFLSEKVDTLLADDGTSLLNNL